ncbi:MAG TPA: hypothetical protein VJP77_01840, partial [Planctomycetota bacterium]|nr:hypothetical protein [Planctomycetota bacterium]
MQQSLLAGALALAAGAALAGPVRAQSNQIPGTDVKLGLLQQLVSMGRSGAFPNGLNALAMSTTSCNVGTVQVPWLAAMAEDHPFISFLIARDDGTRLRQISNRSFVKHGFFALANSQCTPCQGGSPQGLFLGIGCSDTYSTSNNGNNFWLGPPEEIDSWLGEWEATCSFFDAGLFPNPPFDCDGSRSFNTTQANGLGPVGNRVQVRDLDLVVAGGDTAAFWYQAHYVIRGEPEANRNNNLGSRAFIPTFDAGQNQWNFQIGGALLEGSLLQRWPGAQIGSATNGGDDGRVYVAVKVSGPTAGLYHYEYAVHNRDSHRGVGELRIPICPGAQVTGIGTLDPDTDAANDWSAAVEGSELVFSANTQPVQWNTIHNFWFDSDAAPSAANLSLPLFQPGPGAGALTIASSAPLGLFNVVTGPGCGAGGVAPTLFATG